MLRQRAHVLRGLRPTPHFRSHSYDVDVGLGLGHCWIDSQCYAEGETNRPGGHSCQVCDPWKSQTEWSMASTVGQSECFIPTRTRFCHPAGSVIKNPTDSRGRDHNTLADCMICDPTESGTAWTTIPSYEPVDLSDPEPVCTLKAAYQPLPPPHGRYAEIAGTAEWELLPDSVKDRVLERGDRAA